MSSAIVHFECRNPDHLRMGSRHGIGGFVIHHGSVGYCAGASVDGSHRWVPTGGVPVQYLYDTSLGVDGPGTYRAREGAHVHVRSSASGKPMVEIDGDSRSDVDVGVKIPAGPGWPDHA